MLFRALIVSLGYLCLDLKKKSRFFYSGDYFLHQNLARYTVFNYTRTYIPLLTKKIKLKN